MAIEVNCNNCGKSFEIYPSRYKQSDNFYCEKECEKIYRQRETPSGSNSDKYERVETCCDYCGSDIEIVEWCFNNYENNFCGNQCKNNWQSENIRGENHPNYKDGRSAPSKYPREFYKIREEVLDKYSKTCVLCGMNQKQHRKKYNKGICVHHIDGDVDNNNIDNLVVLCQKCNSRVEHIDFRPSITELKNSSAGELFNENY